jgi:hypothetical protein
MILRGRSSIDRSPGEVTEYRKPFKFVLHMTGGNLRKREYVQEIYELSENT